MAPLPRFRHPTPALSMMNGRAGQLVEFIPPSRMFKNIFEFVTRGATAYGMIK